MAKKAKKFNSAWEYADWLFLSGRLTAEEHLTLKDLLVNMEIQFAESINSSGC